MEGKSRANRRLKILAVVLALLLIQPRPAKALFGEDLIYLAELIAKAEAQIGKLQTQIDQQVRQYQIAVDLANFVQHPGNLQSKIAGTLVLIGEETAEINRQRPGTISQHDIDVLNSSMNTTTEIMREVGRGRNMSTMDAVSIANLQMREVELKSKRDDLQGKMDFSNSVDNYYTQQESTDMIGSARWVPR